MKNNFKKTSAIKKIWKIKPRKKIIQGGTSAGKTWAILPLLADEAIENPGTEISIVSESVPHLRRGVLKDFLKIMKMTGRYISNNYNKTHMTYTFCNGSYIEFFSVDDESKLRGARRNILYVNEANNINFESYYQLAIRTSGDIYVDFNPTLKFWAHTEVEPQEDAELIILTYKDNEALGDNIVKELELNRVKAFTSSYWENWWKVYGEGKIGLLEGVIFDNWSEIDRVPPQAKLIGSGMDFGFTNDPTTMVTVYKMDNNIYADEVIYGKGLHNSDIANLIKQEEPGVIYADSAEPKSISEIKRYGIKILPATKGRDSIMYGISILQEYNIIVTKRSTNLKDELNKYGWKKDKEGNTLNVPVDNYNHCIDALRYLAMMCLKKNSEIRRSFVIN